MARMMDTPGHRLDLVGGDHRSGVGHDELDVLGAYRFGQEEQPLPPPRKPVAGTALRAYDASVHESRGVPPYTDFLMTYQKVALLRGPLLGLLLLVGAAGSRRRSLLPCVAAIALLAAPVAVLDFGQRYVLPVFPLSRIAAARGVTSIRDTIRRRTRPAAQRPGHAAG